VFVPGRPFHPKLMFERKAGTFHVLHSTAPGLTNKH
jgi:hypothetical protein